MNVLAKTGYENGLQISRYFLIRHIVLVVCSYTFGKFQRGTNFDLRNYDFSVIKLIAFRCVLSTISKALQFSAIKLIPLALSSTISFTTGPFFGAALAFMLIREKLSRLETLCIIGGACGTVMLTMP